VARDTLKLHHEDHVRKIAGVEKLVNIGCKGGLE
jgi:hypothetical protein